MSSSDLTIIAVLAMFVSMYGAWAFMFVQDTPTQFNTTMVSQNYTTPEASGFFETISSMAAFSVSTPEILFLNISIFLVFSVLIVMIALRFVRGQG